jgi:3'-5' exoribonuclease
MLDFILARVDEMADAGLQKLVRARLDECGDALKYYPAASKLHHAERSGLLHHTSTMLRMAEHVCQIYPQLDADLLAAGVILHDLCKIDEMASDEIGMVSDYTAQGMLIGHLVQGVAELDRCGRKLKVQPELLMMLEHMILSHHDLPEYGSPKPPMFPEAEVLHVLDLLDARMFEMQRELKNAPPGGFTERIWSLERKLYRRKEGAGEN